MKKMSLEDLQDLYRANEVKECDGGYEVVDRETGIIYGVPDEYTVFIDGKPLDPTRFLTMSLCSQRLMFDEVINPLEVKYNCGSYVLLGERMKFYPAGATAKEKRLEAVLVKAHWDMREASSDYRWDEWMQRRFGKDVVWSLRRTDAYEVSGDWYWLITVRPDSSIMSFGLNMILADYARVLETVYKVARVAMEKFERNKVKYQRWIAECLGKLPGRIHWIVAAEEGELWPKYDANRELWMNNEYDWQIVEFDDYLEVRGRGGSPGVLVMETVRYDATGAQLCRDFLQRIEE